MINLKERYVVDEKGNRVEVILTIEDYRKLLAELEELESIRAYDAAKASEDEVIPFEQAVAEIESRMDVYHFAQEESNDDLSAHFDVGSFAELPRAIEKVFE